MKYALEVENLSVYYHKSPVVWDVNLCVPQQKLACILGPNGAGKTTFVKSLLSIIKPSSGCIKFFDQPLKKAKKQIAYVPQRNSVDWDFPITSYEVVLMGAYQELGWLKHVNKVQKAKAMQMLKRLQMDGFAKRQIGELSGGQQQRLFIARALMQDAKIYFFDEPFAGVDLTTETFLIDLFKEMVQQGKTIFVVHHDLAKVEQYFDWGILLNTRLIASGEIQDVFNMDMLCETFGNKEEILERALMLSNNKLKGYK